jgi:hypothetical protein
VALERRHRVVSALLAPTPDAPSGLTLATLAVIVLWLGHGYLGRGLLLSGDTIAHVSMLATRVRATLDGADPTWSNFKYLGLPLQAFYAPTTFWPLLGAALLTGDTTLALRGFLLAAHLLSGFAAWALARQLGTPRTGALFAGIIYAGSFAHLHLLLYRGAIPQALSAALLPACLLYAHRIATGRWTWRGSWAGLAATAAGLLVNYTPFAIVGGVHIALFALVSLALAPAGPGPAGEPRAGGPRAGAWRGRPGRLAALVLAGAAAGVLSACVLLPAALTHSEVLPLSVGHLLYLAPPGLAYLDQLVVWRNWRTDFPGGAAYLGLVPLVLAGIGISRLGRGPDPMRRTVALLLGLLALSLVLRGQHVRDIMLTVLFVALLAGLGAAALLRRMASGRSGLARSGPAILLGLVLLDLGSTAIQPIGRSDKGWLEAAGAWLAARRPSSRTVEMDVAGDRLTAPAGPSITAWSPTEFTIGGHVEMATPAWIYGEMAGYLIERDWRAANTLAPRTRDLLCLLRVGRISGIGRTRMGLPERLEGAAPEGPLGRVVAPGCGWQAIFAPVLAPTAIAPFDPHLDYAPRYGARLIPAFEAHLDAVLAGMDLDRATGTAARILVPDLTAPMAAPVTTEGDPAPALGPVVTTPSYAVGSARIDIDLRASQAGFVRLSHAWHPRLRVLRDGQPVDVWHDVTGCVVIAVPRGASAITIIPASWGPQTTGDAISAAAAAALAGMVLAGWSRRRRPADGEAPGKAGGQAWG